MAWNKEISMDIEKDFDFLQFVDRPFLSCPCLCDDIIVVTLFVVDDCVLHFLPSFLFL